MQDWMRIVFGIVGIASGLYLYISAFTVRQSAELGAFSVVFGVIGVLTGGAFMITALFH